MGADQPRRDYLKRLPAEYYQGFAYVHWTMTTEERKQGWLTPETHAQFRELLLHTAFRYALMCPVYCLMPDHFHLLWIGLFRSSDQLKAMKFLRKHTNVILDSRQTTWQKQAHDHVLKEAEQQQDALEKVIEYIARNPERAGLVNLDQFHKYPYSGCIIPGYPDVSLRNENFSDRLWRSHELLVANQLFRMDQDETESV